MNPVFQNGGFDPSASPDDFIDQILSAIQRPAVEFADETLLPYFPTGPGGFTDESASDSRQQQIGQNNDEFHGSCQALYGGFAAAALLAGDSSRSNSFLDLQGNNRNLGAEDAWLREVQGRRTQAQTRPSSSATAAGAPSRNKPRGRARRGQATDPHSIAERLRREKISERMKALQQLVPIANKTDKGLMVDEIVDYVKFLQLQVKLLSMSRLGGGAAAAAAASIASEGDGGGGETTSSFADNSLTMSEKEVAKLMEEDMGTAMQYLQGKGLCLIPISAATPRVSPSRPRRRE